MNIVSDLSKWIKTKFQPSQKDEDSSMEYKILILGEHEVGKTSVCNRFIMNEFNLEIKPTKESECYTKNIQFPNIGTIIKLVGTSQMLCFVLGDLTNYLGRKTEKELPIKT